MSTANDIDLATRIRDFASSRVLVVGDVMLDRFIIGSVNRISPEAPVCRYAYSMLGGAGNVMRNVAALSALFPLSVILHLATCYVTPVHKLNGGEVLIFCQREDKLQAARQRRQALRQARPANPLAVNMTALRPCD